MSLQNLHKKPDAHVSNLCVPAVIGGGTGGAALRVACVLHRIAIGTPMYTLTHRHMVCTDTLSYTQACTKMTMDRRVNRQEGLWEHVEATRSDCILETDLR